MAGRTRTELSLKQKVVRAEAAGKLLKFMALAELKFKPFQKIRSQNIPVSGPMMQEKASHLIDGSTPSH